MIGDVAPRRTWRAWFTPPAGLDAAERRTAELVAFLLLIMEACAIVAVALGALLAPSWLAHRWPIVLALIIGYGGALALNRTRYYQAAATVFCLVPLLGNAVGGVIGPGDPTWFAFLPVGAMLAGALLSRLGRSISW